MRELTAMVRLAVRGTLLGLQSRYIRLLHHLNVQTHEKAYDRLRKVTRDWEIHKGRK